MSDKPLVFITNDDGYFAKGINELVCVVSKYAKVIVMAPDQSRSGFSSAFTVKEKLRITKISDQDDVTVYSTTGTPADCAKLAFYKLFAEQKPDLVISGINHGSNASVNAVYSGTVGAALEGCINHVPSIAFSSCDPKADADFSPCLPIVDKIVRFVLKNSLPHGTMLNVNFPEGEVKGWRICREADAYWCQEFEQVENADGEAEFSLTGTFVNREPEATDTDIWALENGFASIVPISVRRTDFSAIDMLNKKFI